jgi:hypothetical protein
MPNRRPLAMARPWVHPRGLHDLASPRREVPRGSFPPDPPAKSRQWFAGRPGSRAIAWNRGSARSAAPAAIVAKSSRLPTAPVGAGDARPAREGGWHIGPDPHQVRPRNRRRLPRPSPRSAATTPRAAAAPTALPWPGAEAGSKARRAGPDAPVRGRRYHAGSAPRPPAAEWQAGAGRPGTDLTGRESEGLRGASGTFARLARGTAPGPRARQGRPSLAGVPCGGGRPAAAWRGSPYPAARALV